MFFEDPALLVGLPMLAVGVFGLFIAIGALLAPQSAGKAAGATAVAHVGHPGEAEYIRIGLFLGALTAIEVVIYYFNIPRGVFIVMLLALSAVKFTAVVMFFMHLKFDSRIFTTAFVTGMALAGALFTVVLVTLGSNFV
jgi:cytochrome c oxidase subunit 4